MKKFVSTEEFHSLSSQILADGTDTVTQKTKTVRSKLFHRTEIHSKKHGKLVLEITGTGKIAWIQA